MSNKFRIILAIVAICILSFIDYQFFNETPGAYTTPQITRRIYHLFCMLSIAGIGYFGFSASSLKWQKKIYLFFYALALVVILLITFLNKQFGLFSQTILNVISSLREDFNTPIPFFIVFAVGVSINKMMNSKDTIALK